MFDIIIGNPPYQKQLGTTNRLAIWPLFVEYSLDNLKNNGYLLFVHPSGWRNPDGAFRNIYNKILDNNLIYLNMNDTKKGQEIFKASTNFDFYLLRNNSEYKTTKVIDINDNEYNIDLKEWDFIPSGKFDDFEKLLSKNKEEKIELMHSSLYHHQRKYVSKKKTEVYKYPCIWSINKNGISYYYSSEKKGQFDIPKVIFSNGAGDCIKDEKGEYGLTQFAYAIVDKVENLEAIKNAMNSTKFIELMKYAIITTNNKYNHKVIGLFKKDFYKEFI